MEKEVQNSSNNKGFIITVIAILTLAVFVSSFGSTYKNLEQKEFLSGKASLTTCEPIPDSYLKNIDPSQLPIPVQVVLTRDNLKGLASSYILGSTITQSVIFNPDNYRISFESNDCPIDIINFYLTSKEAAWPSLKKYMQFDLNFNPPITVADLNQQTVYIMGQLYKIGTGLSNKILEIQLVSLDDGKIIGIYYSNIGDGLPAELNVNGQVIEDAPVTFELLGTCASSSTCSIQDILFDHYADAAPGCKNIHLPPGEPTWRLLLDEPQALLGLDWDFSIKTGQLGRTPYGSKTFDIKSLSIEYQLPYCAH